jgi:cytochrome P450
MNINSEVRGPFIPPKGLLEAETPFHWHEEMRKNHPVRFDPQRNCWDVFLYDDVKRVLSDYESFSSQTSLEQFSIVSMDPPKHRLYRSIVSKAFTPKSVNDFAPRIHQITNELLDEVAGKGEMDMIADLAFPLPTIVIAELLGVPKEDREQFKKWSDEVVRGTDIANGETPEQLIKSQEQVTQEIFEYFTKVIENKRRNPRNDLISALLSAKVEEQSLSLTELLQFCFLLLVAGNETTTNLIGNAMVCFLDNPDIQKQLREDLTLLPGAIEEVLRYRSPIQSLIRVCVRDTELSGQTVQAGQPVIVWVGSANRDETIFEQANQYILRRSPNRHIAFGNGPHFCLGAPLARLESNIALRLVFEKLPFISPKKGIKPNPVKDMLIHGYKSIPIAF